VSAGHDFHVAEPERRVCPGDLIARRLGAAQQRVHASDKLEQSERLRHIVVGAHAEPAHFVAFLGARGENQNGKIVAPVA